MVWHIRNRVISYSSRLGFLALLALAACRPQAASPTGTIPPVTDAALIQSAAGTSEPSPTPFVMPSPPPRPGAICPGAPREELIIHERGWVLADDPRPLNVRREPTTTSDIMTRIPVRGIFYVERGPECAEDYAWYFVAYQGFEGWIAEGDLTSYYVAPYPPG